MKITSISLPNRVADVVVEILKDKGFETATWGSGEVTFEKEGELTNKEIKDLKSEMANEVFEFVVYD